MLLCDRWVTQFTCRCGSLCTQWCIATIRSCLWTSSVMFVLSRPANHHITSHHITSHHITSHHITLHHVTSHHITSHHITSHHIASRHITSHHITSHHITSHHISLGERAVKQEVCWQRGRGSHVGSSVAQEPAANDCKQLRDAWTVRNNMAYIHNSNWASFFWDQFYIALVKESRYTCEIIFIPPNFKTGEADFRCELRF